MTRKKGVPLANIAASVKARLANAVRATFDRRRVIQRGPTPDFWGPDPNRSCTYRKTRGSSPSSCAGLKS